MLRKQREDGAIKSWPIRVSGSARRRPRPGRFGTIKNTWEVPTIQSFEPAVTDMRFEDVPGRSINVLRRLNMFVRIRLWLCSRNPGSVTYFSLVSVNTVWAGIAYTHINPFPPSPYRTSPFFLFFFLPVPPLALLVHIRGYGRGHPAVRTLLAVPADLTRNVTGSLASSVASPSLSAPSCA